MILKQGHKYEPMPHDGKVIRRIYRGGRCYYKDSPYSLAATQALKAAFPQYWTAIRDYGWANPALVPFVNEDPMLIVSLVEVGKTRYLYNVGKPYIDTGFVPTKDTSIDIMYDKQGKENYPYGSAISYNSRSFETYNNELHFGYSANVNYISNGIVHMWSNRNQYWWTNGGKEYSYTFSPFNDTFPYTLYLWALHRASIITSANELKMWFFKIYDNDQLVRHFVPCHHQGEAGMLDVVTATFYPNANTQGAFTIQVTDKA